MKIKQATAKVCRLWKDLIDGSAELRYNVELWADGMVAGFATVPAVERLEALYAYRRAWSNMNLTAQTVISIDPAARAYELVHGVLAQQSMSVFAATWLPSGRDHTTKQTSRVDLGVEPRDFVMDPTQDLVAFVYERAGDFARVECRSLSSLQAHPLAAVPILSFPVDLPLGPLAFEIADDVIGLFLARFGRIVIFNWRRGTLIMVCTPIFPLTTWPTIKASQDVQDATNSPSDPCSFSLLSPRAYILGHALGSGGLEILAFEDGETIRPTHIATLQLPLLAAGSMVEYIMPHSACFRANPTAGKLFSKSNADRLCALSLDYGEEFFCLLVHHRYLETYLSKVGGGTIVPWDQWGPQHSRMLSGTDHRWLRFVIPLLKLAGPLTLIALQMGAWGTRGTSSGPRPPACRRSHGFRVERRSVSRDVARAAFQFRVVHGTQYNFGRRRV